MMAPRLTHQDCTSKVCVVCFSPAKVPINTLLEERVRMFVHKEYSLTDIHLPTSLCSSCVLWLREKANGKPFSTRSDPHIYDISVLLFPPPNTRLTPTADQEYKENINQNHCYMCTYV